MRLIAIALLVTLVGCGITQSQVDTFTRLDSAKGGVYGDVSQTFKSLVKLVDKHASAGSVTKAEMARVTIWLAKKDEQFARLVRESVRAITAMKGMSPEEQERYMELGFRVIDKIKGGGK